MIQLRLTKGFYKSGPVIRQNGGQIIVDWDHAPGAAGCLRAAHSVAILQRIQECLSSSTDGARR
jgi:hypothetical protein